MEWMLQVVDEIDDAVGVLRHGWLGLSAQMKTMLPGLKSQPGRELRGHSVLRELKLADARSVEIN